MYSCLLNFNLKGAFRNLLLAVPLLLFALAPPGHSQEQQDPFDQLSLEELGSVPAVLSSKYPSQLFDTPTGSFIFDESAIQNLPVDSIPEMLRYAPGVHIIRPSNGIWGVGMRGINSRFFNRVQFTVDEQNIYSSIFAGLFGSQHDLLMDDVASVEVAYGPGGGTWDNNAVNGRVNVLMKTAFETEGSLLKTNLGTESRGVASRIGWAIDESTSARVYAKANQRDSSITRFPYENDWDTARAGFRLDKRPNSQELFSISAEVFYSNLGYAYNLADFKTGDLSFQSDSELLRGANAQIKWTRNDSNNNAYSVRSWFGYSDLDAAYAKFGMGAAGVEGRARFQISEGNAVSFNLGATYDEEDTTPTKTSDWTSDHLHNNAAYGGFQNELSLIRYKLDLTWGMDLRFESKSNITTGSPNASLIYQISDNDRLWASYSRAERTTPVALSVIDSLRSGKAIEEPINIQTIVGDFSIEHSLTNAISNRELNPETLNAFEAGYRKHLPNDKGNFWINTFYYDYDDIFARIGVSAVPSLFTQDPYLNIEGTYENLLEGSGYGFEAFLEYKFTNQIRATASYSRLKDSFNSLIDSDDPFVLSSILFSIDEFDNSSPGHLATLNLDADLTCDWNLNTGLRYSSSYEFAKGYQPAIFQLDARLSWQLSDKLRLSLVGRNLLDPRIQEARLKDFFGHWTEMKREVYLEAKAEF